MAPQCTLKYSTWPSMVKYDIKPSYGEAPALEIWRMWSTIIAIALRSTDPEL